ncbi:hypothetical protein FKP32DRAFT_1330822 [Trametes sanguinea]|nr:hypothetical protein FKP32DRAFT_1330822 [Trametes sanguinea]
MASPKKSDSMSASPRPSSPSPARSVRSRMTSAMRRASTGLAFGTKIPTLSRSSSKNSLKVDPAQAPSTSETHVAPSPVVETAEESSPSAPTQLGPSPLQNSSTPEPASQQAPEEPSVEPSKPSEPALQPEPELTTVEAPSEQPVEQAQVDEQLTRSPEQLPAELHPAPPAQPPSFGFSDPIIPPTTEAPPVTESPVIVPKDDVAVAPMPEPTPAAPLPPLAEAPAPPATEDRRADYFAFSDPVVPTVAAPKAEEPRIVEAAPPSIPATPATKPIPVEEPARYPEIPHAHFSTDDSTTVWSDEPALGHKRSHSSLPDPVLHTLETSEQSGLASGKVSTRASKSSLASSYGNPVTSSGEQRRGRSSSVR